MRGRARRFVIAALAGAAAMDFIEGDVLFFGLPAAGAAIAIAVFTAGQERQERSDG